MEKYYSLQLVDIDYLFICVFSNFIHDWFLVCMFFTSLVTFILKYFICLFLL